MMMMMMMMVMMIMVVMMIMMVVVMMVVMMMMMKRRRPMAMRCCVHAVTLCSNKCDCTGGVTVYCQCDFLFWLCDCVLAV